MIAKKFTHKSELTLQTITCSNTTQPLSMARAGTETKLDDKVPIDAPLILNLELDLRIPVHVEKVDGKEQIVYRPSLMDQDKPYYVLWDGDYYALKKTNEGVEFFKFHPDEK